MGDDLQTYRTVLRHIVRPDDYSIRIESPSVMLYDWEALFLHECLQEYAAYDASSDEYRDIAYGYAEFIDMTVRQENAEVLYLYAHTRDAWTVLLDALRHSDNIAVSKHVNDRVSDAFISFEESDL
ncbi:hypothetical protein M1M34_gp097 [Haloarcula tailed virus 2]|uniref:Uncharacterized protein n=1 Tax=Haloarcula tailed virus 2 TaxID=2877989 RepID=A0AAE8XZC8_9CAUD|nr:hypothetical protein M1M34_gp097 [Haloarcula tailed virus 2]UBF23236.1 hypothetical protein HATV-2_gp85 [Haloarcula tailed virus 2]